MKRTLLFVMVSVLLISCGGRQRPKQEEVILADDTIETTVPNPIKPVINVFIENSGSMDGFTDGTNDFKKAIYKLLVDLNYYSPESLKIFFICNDRNERIQVKQTTLANDLSRFINELDGAWQSVGKRGTNTDLNNVFEEVLKRTEGDCISILISDCIYSVGRGGVEDLLDAQKALTYNAFLHTDSALSTTILKMESRFLGRYYPYIGDAHHFTVPGDKLPYYICVFSNQQYMAELSKAINFESLSGFVNKYVISRGGSGTVYYSILISTFNNGRFRPQRDGLVGCVHGIEDIRLDRDNNPLTFAIAMNLEGIDVDESYLLQPDNYSLSEDDFEVVEVKRINKSEINPSDWHTVSANNPTHVMILRVTSKKIPTVKLVISLKKQMPKWIAESSILDDTRLEYIQNGKTFGLEYWITGIAEAYSKRYPDDINYFEFTINLKK